MAGEESIAQSQTRRAAASCSPEEDSPFQFCLSPAIVSECCWCLQRIPGVWLREPQKQEGFFCPSRHAPTCPVWDSGCCCAGLHDVGRKMGAVRLAGWAPSPLHLLPFVGGRPSGDRGDTLPSTISQTPTPIAYAQAPLSDRETNKLFTAYNTEHA